MNEKKTLRDVVEMLDKLVEDQEIVTYQDRFTGDWLPVVTAR